MAQDHHTKCIYRKVGQNIICFNSIALKSNTMLNSLNTYSDLVNWILQNVDGITDRREARKFIGNMLRKNYIKHTVNKLTFSENSYYQFGEGDGSSGHLLNEDDGMRKSKYTFMQMTRRVDINEYLYFIHNTQ